MENLSVALTTNMLNHKRKYEEMMDNIQEMYVNNDFRKKLKIDQNDSIEVKYYIVDENKYKWLSADIIQMETGRFHKFHETDDDESEYETSPIVTIKDETGDEIDVCFLSDRLVYSIKYDAINAWRKEGSDFDMSEEEIKEIINDEISVDEEESDEETVKVNFKDEAQVKIFMDNLVSDIMENILVDKKLIIDNLDFKTKRELAVIVAAIKDEQVKNMTDYVVRQTNLKGKSKQVDKFIDRKEIIPIMCASVVNVLERFSGINVDSLRTIFEYK